MLIKELLGLYESTWLVPFVYILDTNREKQKVINENGICFDSVLEKYGDCEVKKYKIVNDEEGYDFWIYI